jgi:hypothetical protein
VDDGHQAVRRALHVAAPPAGAPAPPEVLITVRVRRDPPDRAGDTHAEDAADAGPPPSPPPGTPSAVDATTAAGSGTPQPCTSLEGPKLRDPWKRKAAWRQAVQRRRLTLWTELAALDPARLSGSDCARRGHLVTLLDDVHTASQERTWPVSWWWGTEVERCWARLREVEERLVDLLPEEQLDAEATRAAQHGNRCLAGDDERVLLLRDLRKEGAGPAALRPAVRRVLHAAHEQTDRRHQEARYLRNRLLLTTGLVVAAAIAVLVAQTRFTDAPFLTAPTGWDGSAARFLVAVMLFGAVGALFTAVPAMSKVPADFSPFNLPLQQAILKLAVGPLAALLGFAILESGVLESAPPTTWPGVLLTATVFGAGQQAVTGFVDRRAGEVLAGSEAAARAD